MVGCKDLQINVSIMHGEDCDEESIMGARSSGVNLPLTCWDHWYCEVLREYRISNAQVSIRCNATMGRHH